MQNCKTTKQTWKTSSSTKGETTNKRLLKKKKYISRKRKLINTAEECGFKDDVCLYLNKIHNQLPSFVQVLCKIKEIAVWSSISVVIFVSYQ